jgi:hypothetical protein
MQKQIKRFAVEDYDKFIVVFDNEFIKKYGIVEGDEIFIDENQFLIEGVKHG